MNKILLKYDLCKYVNKAIPKYLIVLMNCIDKKNTHKISSLQFFSLHYPFKVFQRDKKSDATMGAEQGRWTKREVKKDAKPSIRANQFMQVRLVEETVLRKFFLKYAGRKH